jgi:hypothetical protein
VKNIFLTSFAIFALLIVANGQSNKGKSHNKTDSLRKQFIYHFKILDAASKINRGDTVYCCRTSVNFMEYHTEIEAGTIGNVLGRLGFTKAALNKWHEWYRSKYIRRKE